MIADVVSTHDKVGRGYGVTHVSCKQTGEGIFLLNSEGANAKIHALIAFNDLFEQKCAQPMISEVGHLNVEHFDVFGQTVTVKEYEHDVYRKNQPQN